jgi:hypothetical protein
MLIAARSSPGFGLLLACDRQCTFETGFGSRDVRLRRLERYFACDAINICLEPSFFGSLNHCRRFVNGTPSVVKLAKVCIAFGHQ